MLEKRLIAVPPQLFTTDGSIDGIITIVDTKFFKVKQEVILTANTLPNLDNIEIKRILSATQLAVGPKTGNIDSRVNISAYTVALSSSIFANEQKRASIPFEELTRAVYEEEPTVAERSVLVDKYGNKIDSRVDSNGVNRLAVDGQFSAEVDVQVDVDVQGEYDATNNSNPDSIGSIGHERSNPTNKTHQNQRITAKRGTIDTDSVSQDVSIHDKDGNGIDSTTNSSGRSLDTLTPDNTTSGSISALDGTISMSLSGLGSIGFQITNGGDFVGTLVVECSLDGGTSWKTVPFLDVLNSAIYQSIAIASVNTLQIFSIIPLGGASHVRILASAYTSGTANIVIRGSKVIGTTGQVTSAAFATVSNTYPSIPKNTATLILAANPNRKYAYISNNSSSIVNIQFGSDTGLSAVTGLVIDTNKVIEIKGDSLFTGNIYAYTGGNNVIISVTEGTP